MTLSTVKVVVNRDAGDSHDGEEDESLEDLHAPENRFQDGLQRFPFFRSVRSPLLLSYVGPWWSSLGGNRRFLGGEQRRRRGRSLVKVPFLRLTEKRTL